MDKITDKELIRQIINTIDNDSSIYYGSDGHGSDCVLQVFQLDDESLEYYDFLTPEMKGDWITSQMIDSDECGIIAYPQYLTRAVKRDIVREEWFAVGSKDRTELEKCEVGEWS